MSKNPFGRLLVVMCRLLSCALPRIKHYSAHEIDELESALKIDNEDLIELVNESNNKKTLSLLISACLCASIMLEHARKEKTCALLRVKQQLGILSLSNLKSFYGYSNIMCTDVLYDNNWLSLCRFSIVVGTKNNKVCKLGTMMTTGKTWVSIHK